MIRVLFLFLFCLVTSLLFAQNKEGIKPFMDYSQCYTGFRNAAGVKIWQPEFDWVQQISRDGQRYQEYSYWKVKYCYGLVGLLDLDGKKILPFIYDDLFPVREDLICAQLNGLWGIIDLQGNTLVEFAYDKITPHAFGYLVKKDGRYGILNLDFEVILDPVYDKIENAILLDGYEGSETYSNIIYLIKIANLYGVLDIHKGVIVEPKHQYIDVWEDGYCDGSVSAFIVFDSLDQSAVFNSEADLVVPFGHSYKYVFTCFKDSCGKSSVPYAILQSTDSTLVYNLKNGVNSGWHKNVFVFQNRILFLDKNEWGILDADFREIYRTNKFLPSYYLYDTPMPVSSHGYCESSDKKPKSFDLSWTDDLIFICRSINLAVPVYDREYTIGLLNYVTGATIPAKYSQIQLRIKDGQKYFWAYRNHTTNKNKTSEPYLETVDVYNGQMKKIGSQTYSEIEYGRSEYSVDYTNRLIIVKNEEGLYGAISVEGDLIVPFNYDYFMLPNNAHHLYVFGSNEKRGLFDANGNQVIPEEYKDIRVLEDSTIVAKKEKKADFYSSEFKLIIEDVEHLDIRYNLSRKGGGTYPEKYPRVVTHLLVRNDTLIVYEHGKLLKGDSTRFDFEQDYLHFSNRTIHRSGRVFPYDKNKNSPPDLRLKSPYPGTIPVANSKDSIPYLYWRNETSFSDPTKTAWHLYDSVNMTRIHEIDFEFPFAANIPFVRIFKANGFFGIISEKYEILVQPEYEYIYSLDGSFALLKDGLWQIYSPKHGFFNDYFTAICTYSYKAGRVVFNGRKVGVIDKNFEMIVPLTDSIEVIESLDLLKLFEIKGFDLPTGTYQYEGFIYNAQPGDLYRQLNNRHLLEKAWLRSTANEMLEYWIDPIGFNYMYACSFPTQRIDLRYSELNKKVVPTCFTQYYYSEAVYAKKRISSHYGGHNDWSYSHATRSNYKIENSTLIPITFEDIFKTDSVSVRKLNELIIKELNSSQSLGLTCNNMEEVLSEMKQNFILSDYSIFFSLAGTGYATQGGASISYSKLEPILLEPWKFDQD